MSVRDDGSSLQTKQASKCKPNGMSMTLRSRTKASDKNPKRSLSRSRSRSISRSRSRSRSRSPPLRDESPYSVLSGLYYMKVYWYTGDPSRPFEKEKFALTNTKYFTSRGGDKIWNGITMMELKDSIARDSVFYKQFKVDAYWVYSKSGYRLLDGHKFTTNSAVWILPKKGSCEWPPSESHYRKFLLDMQKESQSIINKKSTKPICLRPPPQLR